MCLIMNYKLKFVLACSSDFSFSLKKNLLDKDKFVFSLFISEREFLVAISFSFKILILDLRKTFLELDFQRSRRKIFFRGVVNKLLNLI